MYIRRSPPKTLPRNKLLPLFGLAAYPTSFLIEIIFTCYLFNDPVCQGRRLWSWRRCCKTTCPVTSHSPETPKIPSGELLIFVACFLLLCQRLLLFKVMLPLRFSIDPDPDPPRLNGSKRIRVRNTDFCNYSCFSGFILI